MSKHTRQKQVEVLTDVSIHGNVRKACREHGVSHRTVEKWIQDAKRERLEVSTPVLLEDATVAVSGQVLPAVPPLPFTPEPTEPLWYEVETNSLAIVRRKVEALIREDNDYTVQDLKLLTQMAATAHNIRTGLDRLSVGTGAQVAVQVVFTDAQPRDGGLPLPGHSLMAQSLPYICVVGHVLAYVYIKHI